MNLAQADRLNPRPSDDVARFDEEMTEVRLLLPQRQLLALELAACSRELSTGEMLRRILAACLDEFQHQLNPVSLASRHPGG